MSEKINSWEYSNPIECAKDAIGISTHRDCVVRVKTDSLDEYSEICAYLQGNEDFEENCRNGDEFEHWGCAHMKCENKTWRVHVVFPG